ncbi:MAG: SRPBCC family protein [Anaerolineales bacterium]
MSNPIQQTVTFQVSPHEVYEALMDSAKHAAFSGSAAEISREVGGAYSAYGGYITGKNLELTPDQKIVQSWRAVDWPEGKFSTVTFVLLPIPGGTRLDFTHVDVPDGTEAEFTQGWIDNYWNPMKAMLEKA